MQDEKKGFFDGNPKMLFVFGLVTGVALTAIFGGGISLPSAAGSSDSNTVASAPSPSPSPNPSQAPPPSNGGTPPPVTDEDHIRGDKNAPLTFIEYSDFECPFCKRFHPTTQQMMDEYGDSGQVKFVYRHFPLSFHNPLATTQAEAAECANELGGNDAFWEMTDEIFERTSSNGNGMAVSELSDIANEIGLNVKKFETCLDDDRYIEHIQADIAGGSAAGVSGTPGSFFIDANGNAQLISGAVPYSQIKAIIDAAL